jgi:3-dehydroquinate synthetase
MTINELGGAYDLLLGILKQREDLVKERLKESLKNFGREEKILFESQDSRKEMETMPNILQKLYDHDATEIDAILGLNE